MSAPKVEKTTVYGLRAEAALRGLGRADLLPHLAAWKEGEAAGWKSTDVTRLVSDVRDEYDRGTVEVVHCHTPHGTALLAIKRRRRVVRKTHEKFSNLEDFAVASEKVKRCQVRGKVR